MEDSAMRKLPKVLITPKRKLIILTEPPTTGATSQSSGQIIKNPRIIDLTNKSSKMALQRQFNGDGEGGEKPERPRGELHYCVRMTDTSGREFFIPKLPPGTILVRQGTTMKKPIESPMNSLGKRIGQQINSHGVKRTVQPEKTKHSQVRRTPARPSKKEIDEDFPRPRLLALKRRGADANLSDEKKLKLSDVPYMNTRSVTKRLYNVGATLQVPNIQEELKWREWPSHGMHDRPVYHPQVGVATEFMGRCFTSFDGGSYREIPKNSAFAVPSPAVGKRRIPDLIKLSRNQGISFENCMHWTFHSVLSYAASLMAPEYKKVEERMLSSKSNSENLDCTIIDDKIPEKISPTSTSTSFPLFDLKGKLGKPQMSLTCIKNHAKLQQVLERGTKNTLILLKTSDPNLKRESPAVPVQNIDQKKENPKLDEKALSVKSEESQATLVELEKVKHLRQLIADTAVLYCTSMGVHQDDLINYLDGLSSGECRS